MIAQAHHQYALRLATDHRERLVHRAHALLRYDLDRVAQAVADVDLWTYARRATRQYERYAELARTTPDDFVHIFE